MKNKFSLILLLAVYCFVFVRGGNQTLQNTPQEPKPWCYTKDFTNESYSQELIGGTYWSFCKLQRNQGSTSYKGNGVPGQGTGGKDGSTSSSNLTGGYQIKADVAYMFIFYQDNENGIVTKTSSNLYVELIGTKGKMDRTLLSMGMEEGNQNIEMEGVDIGDIQQAKFSLEGTQSYDFDRVEIDTTENQAFFENIEKLQPCHPNENPKRCEVTLSRGGSVEYQIVVTNGFKVENSILLLAICGDNTNSEFIRIANNGMLENQSITVNTTAPNIGRVVGYKLQVTNKVSWHPRSILIRRKSDKETAQFNEVIRVDPQRSKTNQYNCTQTQNYKEYTTMSPETRNYGDSQNASQMYYGEEAEYGTETNDYDINDAMGGLLTGDEKEQMITLECGETAENIQGSRKNNKFGPEEAGPDFNTFCVIAKCPSQCHKSSVSIKGLGAHPFTTPICESAILDKTVSPYGGIIRLCLFKGMKQHELRKGRQPEFAGIKAVEDGPARKSFTTSKIDSVFFSEKDYIIVDWQGRYASKGLAMIRMEGRWGTICNKKNNAHSATVFCRQLGFNSGKWVTNEHTKCRNIDRHDFCGAEFGEIFFYEIDCKPDAETFDDCKKKKATPGECGHSEDAIVECSDSDAAQNTFKEGDVKMDGIIEKDGIYYGQPKMFVDKNWGPLQDTNDRNDAQVLCYTMGYTTGDIIRQPTIKKQLVAPFLAKNNMMQYATNRLGCSGTESKASQCDYTKGDQNDGRYSFFIACSGGDKADPSGLSQIETLKKASPPKVGKLGLSWKNIDCQSNALMPEIKGDIGSAFSLFCPSGCGKTGGAIWGDGIFTTDSSICMAAVHQGVIDDQFGGWVVLTRTYGLKKYKGAEKNNVRSSETTSYRKVSFTVNSSSAVYKNLAKLATGTDSFVEKDISVSLKQVSSFAETDEQYNQKFVPPTVFEYLPENVDHSNTSQTSKLFTKAVPAMEQFTFVATFKMTDKMSPSKRRTIFAYDSQGSLNIGVSSRGHLTIYNEKEKFETTIKIARDEQFQVFVQYTNGQLIVSGMNIGKRMMFDDTKMMEFKLEGSQKEAVGRLVVMNDDRFYGTIDCLLLFDSNIEKEKANQYCDMKKEIQMLQQNDDKQKTIDFRECCSPCYSSGLPGTPGAPKKPAECELNPFETNENPRNPTSGLLKPNTGVPVKPDSDNDWSFDMGPPEGCSPENCPDTGGPSPDADSPGGPPSVQEGRCDTPLMEDEAFKSMGTGEKKVVDCTKCQGHSGVVFGSNPYSDLSNPCEAAFHAGIITDGDSDGGGDSGTSDKKLITVQLGTGKTNYPGSKGQNGVNSNELSGGGSGGGEEGSNQGGADNGGRSFVVMTADPPIKLKCTDTLNTEKFLDKEPNTKLTVTCPKGCDQDADATVFGSEKYNDESSICKAAIHNGTLNGSGGDASLMIGGQMLSFKGKECVGDEKSFDAGPAARHMFFMGEKGSLGSFFKEDGKGNFNSKWTSSVAEQTENTESNSWEYFNDGVTVGGDSQTINGVKHSGLIKTSMAYEAASVVKMFRSNIVNGKIFFTVVVPKAGFFGQQYFFFRMVDTKNLYGIKINYSASYSNIEIFVKVDGEMKVLCQYSYSLLVDKPYSFKVTLFFKNLIVQVKTPSSPNYMTICEKKIEKTTRGYCGFGVSESDGVRFYDFKILPNDGVEKNNFDPSNYPDLGYLAAKTKKKDRKKICSKIKDQLLDYEQANCPQPFVYSRMRCDNDIPKEDKFRNYACFKQIFADSAEQDNLKTKPPNFVPRKNQKIDFRDPSNRGRRIKAVIASLFSKASKLYAKVTYTFPYGGKTTVSVPVTDETMSPCGKILVERADCSHEDTQLTK